MPPLARIRACLFVATLATGLSRSTLASVEEFPVGTRVMPRTPELLLRVETKVSAVASNMTWPQEIRVVKGNNLWIKNGQHAGWVRKTDVLLVKKASVEYQMLNMKWLTAAQRSSYQRLLADCHREGHDYRLAIKECEAALALDPTNQMARLGRAAALVGASENYEQALADCDAVLKQSIENAEAHCLRGRVLGRLQRDEEAIAALTEALRICPDYAEALYGRTLLWLALKQPDKALSDVDELIKIEPKAGHRAMGAMLHAGMTQGDSLADDAGELTKTEPDNPHLRLQAAAMLAIAGKEDQIDPRVYDDPEHALGLHYLIALRYVNESDHKSLDHIEKGLAIRKWPELNYLRAMIYMNRGYYGLACDELTTALDNGRDMAAMFLLRGRCQAYRARFEQARNDFERAIQLEPANPQCVLHRARLSFVERDYAAAVADCQLALTLREPDDKRPRQQGRDPKTAQSSTPPSSWLT